MNDLPSNLAESDPTKVARQLMQKAYNRDGLPEMCIGLYLLTFAALTFVQRILPHTRMGGILLLAATFLVIPLVSFALPRSPKWLRKRFLLSRVGYVKSKSPARRPKSYWGIAMIILVVLALSLAPHWHWSLAATAVAWGGLAVTFGRSLRYWVTAAIAVAAGVWLGSTNIELGLGFAILWGGLGLISLISGTIALLRFLRQPVESEEIERA